ncbi:hypothetical protein [Burkholderia vietnamiensis]|uniref:hypothetical protein n=1 Tax=Burkholderia vietnamiensis TaxID=60552 RepID=UPI00158A7C43|nr:hypothetical protein [Burkholderia vietnamiensis]
MTTLDEYRKQVAALEEAIVELELFVTKCQLSLFALAPERPLGGEAAEILAGAQRMLRAFMHHRDIMLDCVERAQTAGNRHEFEQSAKPVNR